MTEKPWDVDAYKRDALGVLSRLWKKDVTEEEIPDHILVPLACGADTESVMPYARQRASPGTSTGPTFGEMLIDYETK